MEGNGQTNQRQKTQVPLELIIRRQGVIIPLTFAGKQKKTLGWIRNTSLYEIPTYSRRVPYHVVWVELPSLVFRIVVKKTTSCKLQTNSWGPGRGGAGGNRREDENTKKQPAFRGDGQDVRYYQAPFALIIFAGRTYTCH